MKTTFLALATLFIALSAPCQSIVTDTTQTPLKTSIMKADTTETETGYFFQTAPDSTGKVRYYPIYKGAKGGMYYYRTSKKTGERYKVYLTEEQKATVHN
jgi:hypothetical protein